MRIDGTGSIEQLEKSKPRGKCRKWRLWVRSGGRNRSRRFSGTYREAQRALEAFKAELAAEVPEAEAFAAYAKSWADYRRESGAVGPNTVARDIRHVRALSRVLGDRSLDSITPDVCRDALMRLRNGDNASGRVLTNTTMQGMHTVLGQILGQAAGDGRIAANPMANVKPPRKDTPERTALSPEEISLFLNRVDTLPLDGRTMALYLMACLGLRRGEACALMNADMHDGIAVVSWAVKEKACRVDRPKSAAGIRTLPVPPRLQSKVDEWRSVRAEAGLCDAKTLACNCRGGVLMPQNLYRWWHGDSHKDGARDALGCPGMDMHELRHSNLSMMARHLSPFDLQRYAGWSSIEPARIYVHDSMESVVSGVNEAWRVMA